MGDGKTMKDERDRERQYKQRRETKSQTEK